MAPSWRFLACLDEEFSVVRDWQFTDRPFWPAPSPCAHGTHGKHVCSLDRLFRVFRVFRGHSSSGLSLRLGRTGSIRGSNESVRLRRDAQRTFEPTWRDRGRDEFRTSVLRWTSAGPPLAVYRRLDADHDERDVDSPTRCPTVFLMGHAKNNNAAIAIELEPRRP